MVYVFIHVTGIDNMATALLVIIYLTFISLGLPDSVLGSSFPAIARNLNISPEMSGYVGMVISAGTIISSLMSDKLIRKFSTKIIVTVSVLLTAVGLLSFSFVPAEHTWLFYIVAIPMGLGAGGIDSALNNYVALHYKAIHMNWLHACWGVGSSTSPLIIGAFINPDNNSSGWNYGVLTIACIQFFICLVLLCSFPLWKKVEVKEELSKDAEEAKESDVDDRQLHRNLFKNPIFYLAMFGFFCYCSLETSTGLWIGNFFHIGMGLSTDEAAMLTSTFYIGIMIGRFICGPLSLKLNEKTMMRIGESILVIGVVLTFIQVNKYVPMVGFAVVGLGCAPIYPAIIRSTPYRFSKRASQKAMGLEMAIAYIGNLLIPPFIGTLAKSLGDNYLILPYFVGGFAVSMVICHEIINRSLKIRDSKLSEEELDEYVTKKIDSSSK